MSLGPATPALPISDTTAATRFYRERLGFTTGYQEADFAIVHRDECTLHLHDASRSVTATDYGTQEFHVSDGDGNLLTFFRRV